MARRIAVQFIAELTRFGQQMRGGADEVRKVRQEAVAAQREVTGLGAAGDTAGRQLGDGLVRGLDGRIRDARGRFVGAGTRAGRDFGDGFERGARSGIGRVAGMLAGAALQASGSAGRGQLVGLAAIPATAAAAAASLQVLPPLLAAVGGGLGTIPGLAAGAAGSIGTVKLATAGLGDAIEEVFADDRDPYLRLSRNGQQFVSALGAQKQALLGLRSVAQDRVFRGLDAEVTELAAVALPFARTQVERFGDTWNITFRQAAALGRDQQFLAGLNSAFASADGFFDKVNARIPATGRALGGLFTGSIPFVDQFGDSLLEYVDDFSAWIERTSRSGQLHMFFRDAGQQADALLDLTREIFVLVGRIGGMGQGSTLLRDMADAVERFNDEAHNMRSVEGIIRTGNEAIAGVVDVLVVLGETMGDTLADPGTAAAVALFFDVLKVGAQTVGGLVQVFGLLPDQIQAAVLAGAALAIVAGKLSNAFGKAHTAVSGFSERLRQTGPSGVQAAEGIGKAERAVGRLVVTMAAFQVASAAFGSTLNPQVDALSRRLTEFARDGEVAGEAARVLGGDMDKLETAIKDVADTGAWSDFARGAAGFIEGITGLGNVVDDSLTKSRERISALDSALTDMVAAGGMEQARQAFDRIAESAAKQGVSTRELMTVLPSYAAALDKAKAAGDGQAQATAAAEQRTRLLTGSMQDTITAMGSYTRAWEVLNGAQLTADEAALAAKDAIDQVTQSFAENTDTVTGNSRAALENRIAVGQAAQAAAEAAQRKYEETGSIIEATATYDSYIGALRRTLRQADLTDAEIEGLLASYAQMPPVAQTQVSAPGAAAATQQATGFYSALKRLPDGKLVRVNVRGVESAISRVDRLQAEVRALTGKTIRIGVVGGPGGHLEQRWGGYHERGGGWTKAAVGVLREATVYPARYPGRYMIAEPETGGEAFIPLRGNWARSVSIAQKAMDHYGMAVVPKSVVAASQRAMAAMAASAQAGPASGPVTYDNRISVHPQRADFSLNDLDALEARRDAQLRVGRAR